MEIKITTNHLLKVLQVLSWIIFIGLSIEAGGIIFNLIYTFTMHPEKSYSFWEGADLSSLYQYDQGQFIVVAVFMIIVGMLKATMFYLIIKLFVDKKLDMSKPFTAALRRFILNVGYLTLCIGIFSHWGSEYAGWLAAKNIDMPDPYSLHLYGADIWFFMAVTLFVIAQVVKKGIEIQHENDLTI